MKKSTTFHIACAMWKKVDFDFVFKIYITNSTITFILAYRPNQSCPFKSCFIALLISVVGSQNITNKGWLVCIKSEKYAFMITLRPLGSMRWWKSELLQISHLLFILHAMRAFVDYVDIIFSSHSTTQKEQKLNFLTVTAFEK